MNRRPSSAKNVRHTVALMVWAAMFCLIVLSVRAAEPPRELRQARLHLLYSASLFSTVSRNDALAAMTVWMNVTLGESGLGSVNDLFGSNSEAAKSSSVILPVFFGKIDVAVAKHWSWEIMKEMNPQLETQLQILTNSPGLPEAVICINKDVPGFPFRDDLVRGLAELDTDSQGQQILLLFKIDKMVTFQSQHLDGVRDLKARQDELERLRSKTGTVAAFEGKPKS
jgi:hypothetical protein